jgi:hypothetical protein
MSFISKIIVPVSVHRVIVSCWYSGTVLCALSNTFSTKIALFWFATRCRLHSNLKTKVCLLPKRCIQPKGHGRNRRPKRYSCSTTRHEGAWMEWRYSSYSFSTSALDGGEWSASRPGRALAPGKDPRYQVDRRLGGPQSRSGHRG